MAVAKPPLADAMPAWGNHRGLPLLRKPAVKDFARPVPAMKWMGIRNTASSCFWIGVVVVSTAYFANSVITPTVRMDSRAPAAGYQSIRFVVISSVISAKDKHSRVGAGPRACPRKS